MDIDRLVRLAGLTEGRIILGNYEYFLDVWGDHFSELPDEDDYQAERRRLLRHKSFAVYRGFSVAPDWLSTLNANTQLGCYWSTDWVIAEEFANAKTGYDDRFASPEEGSPTIKMILCGKVHVGDVDIDASVASTFATSEQEIRVIEGRMIDVSKIWVDGKWINHPSIPGRFRA